MTTDPTNPFKSRALETTAPMRVLRRFVRPSHVAEIRERTVSAFAAFEWFVFIDGQLAESQMFHGPRVGRYRIELDARIAQFVDNGWVEEISASTDVM